MKFYNEAWNTFFDFEPMSCHVMSSILQQKVYSYQRKISVNQSNGSPESLQGVLSDDTEGH